MADLGIEMKTNKENIFEHSFVSDWGGGRPHFDDGQELNDKHLALTLQNKMNEHFLHGDDSHHAGSPVRYKSESKRLKRNKQLLF